VALPRLGRAGSQATEHTCRAARPPATPPIEARAQVVFNLAEHARRGVQVMRVFGFFNGNGTVRAALAAWRQQEGGGLLGCILRRRHIVSGNHVDIRIFAVALRAVKINTTDLAFHTKQDTPRGIACGPRPARTIARTCGASCSVNAPCPASSAHARPGIQRTNSFGGRSPMRSPCHVATRACAGALGTRPNYPDKGGARR